MAAKVLLGVVALTAIVGSPFAYNHFKSPSGETQKEEEKSTDKQPVAAEKPADSVPEAASDRPEANERAPEQSDDAQGPKHDKCQLNGATSWSSTGGAVSDKSLCVKGVVESQRTPQH